MNALKLILDTKIIAISRGNYGAELTESVEALYRAGIRAVEVAFEQDKTISSSAEALRTLSKRFAGRMAIGAGTVLTVDQLKCAYDNGVEYIVSPNVDPNIISETKRLGLVSIPGAMTPSEIAAAHFAGADIIKVFPAGQLGVKYFKSLQGPFSDMRLAAVAGITLDNISTFSSAGACAFGISSGLFKKDLISQKNYFELERNAAAYIIAINHA